MSNIERLLAYFHRHQTLILERLDIGQSPDSLSDDERVELATRYLSLVSE